MLQTGTNREQSLLFTTLEDLVSQDNPVRAIDFIVDLIIKENTSEFEYKGSSTTGRPAYPFSVLMKLFIYSYMNRVRSSRAMATECKRNLELRWLLQGLTPEFRTIAYFRENYNSIISQFNKYFKRKLISLGLVSTTYAVDGSKLKANASKAMLSRKATLEQLGAIKISMNDYLSSLEQLDEEESSTGELSRSELEKKISSLEQHIMELQGYLSAMDSMGKNHLSTSDIDCNLMKSRDGYIPAYNVQLGVETKNHFIMGDYVSDSVNDIKELEPMIDEIRNETGVEEIITLSDAGYTDLDTLEHLEKDRNVICYSSMPPSRKDNKFIYDKERDIFICPQGKELKRLEIKKSKLYSKVIRYKGRDCGSCPIREQCTTSKSGREISRFSNDKYREAYRDKMSEGPSKSKLKRRMAVVEHVFGNIKVTGGKIPLLLRGKPKVGTEIKLYVLSYNMKRLLAILSYQDLLEAERNRSAKTLLSAQKNMQIFLNLIFFRQIMLYYVFFNSNRKNNPV